MPRFNNACCQILSAVMSLDGATKGTRLDRKPSGLILRAAVMRDMERFSNTGNALACAPVFQQ